MASLIGAKGLGLTLGTTLFSNLDLSIAAGDRLGIVAANGRGKTTLLKCLAGLAEPSTGDLTRSRGLCIGLVEQVIPTGLATMPVRAILTNALTTARRDGEDWRADVALDSLDVPVALHQRPLAELSGGWQRLVMVARAWVAEPDVLILDEPTNHLDLSRIRQLEDWLNDLPRAVAVVIASHDRAFLDATTRRTLFLRPDRSQIFGLPYSRARAAVEDSDAAEERRYQRDMRTARQLRSQAAKLNNIGVNSGSDLLTVKTRQLRQRADRLEAAAKPGHHESSSGNIRLSHGAARAQALIAIDDAPITAPGGALLFRTGRHFIGRGDRVVLLGLNGTGKTCFVRQIKEAIEQPSQGTGPIRATPSLVLGYADQSLSAFEAGDTPLDLIGRRFSVSEQRARSLLAGAGLTIEKQTSRLAGLSGGQKARLAMLCLRLASPSFHLLDEPTNHLDIEGQEALERELTAEGATCLVVSHDRSFVSAVGNRFWLIQNRRLTEVDGPEEFFASAASAGR
jgi:ATPase subunit of ABC transporter with duplicated ATPase domains